TACSTKISSSSPVSVAKCSSSTQSSSLTCPNCVKNCKTLFSSQTSKNSSTPRKDRSATKSFRRTSRTCAKPARRAWRKPANQFLESGGGLESTDGDPNEIPPPRSASE